MKLNVHNFLTSCALFTCMTLASTQQTLYPALKTRQTPVLTNGQLSLVVNTVELASPVTSTRSTQARPTGSRQTLNGQQSFPVIPTFRQQSNGQQVNIQPARWQQQNPRQRSRQRGNWQELNWQQPTSHQLGWQSVYA